MFEKIEKKIKSVPKISYLFIFILILGAFLRFYEIDQRFVFGHDHDLSGWFARDVIMNRHIRLIGQETSTQAFFIGPLYYYAQIPLYLLFKMDPVAQVYTSVIIGLFGIITSYFVFNKIFSSPSGYFASFIYAVAFFTVANDREAVPTMPVIIWSMWYLYGLYQLLNGKQKSFILLGFLLGLIWHFNVALAVGVPLIIITYLMSPKKKLDLKSLVTGILLTILLMLPFIIFEYRHDFIQIRGFMYSLSVGQSDIYQGMERFIRVIYIVNKNIAALIWENNNLLTEKFVGLLIFITIFIFITVKKVISKKLAAILLIWVILYILFFFKVRKPISEYYLNGAFAVYMTVFVGFFAHIYKNKKLRYLVLLFLIIFGLMNFNRVVTSYGKQQTRYSDRMAIVEEIKRDMVINNYPCIAVSYITDPGYNLGFRYFYYLKGIKLKGIGSDIPVYSIVFPIGKDSVKEDIKMGNMGLIYPEERDSGYNNLSEVCKGDDINLTQPMFGFNQ